MNRITSRKTYTPVLLFLVIDPIDRQQASA
jgi:hypothetical protein